MCYSRSGGMYYPAYTVRVQIRAACSQEASIMGKLSKHMWVVDVIEDGSASIEVDGRAVTPIPAWMLPEGVKEGDVLSVTHDRGVGKSALMIETDSEAKRKALEKSAKQMARKSKGDRGGDIQL